MLPKITIIYNSFLCAKFSVHEGNKNFNLIFFSHDARYFPQVEIFAHTFDNGILMHFLACAIITTTRLASIPRLLCFISDTYLLPSRYVSAPIYNPPPWGCKFCTHINHDLKMPARHLSSSCKQCHTPQLHIVVPHI